MPKTPAAAAEPQEFTYRLVGAYPRRYDALRAPDGSTLSLRPGETVTLTEPVDDPWLEAVIRPPQASESASADTSQE